jgi:hypothetical protein
MSDLEYFLGFFFCKFQASCACTGNVCRLTDPGRKRPTKGGGVLGSWDRLSQLRLCFYTLAMSFARQRVIQYSVRKWIRVMRQRCIVWRSLLDAFHERKRLLVAFHDQTLFLTIALIIPFSKNFLENLESFATKFTYLRKFLRLSQVTLVQVLSRECLFN